VVADVRAQNLQLARVVNGRIKPRLVPVANTIFTNRGTCLAQTVALTKFLGGINRADSFPLRARVAVENCAKNVIEQSANEKIGNSVTDGGAFAQHALLRRRHRRRRHRRRVLIHITRRLHAARALVPPRDAHRRHTFLSAFRVRAVERTAFRVRGRQVRRARAARRRFASPFPCSSSCCAASRRRFGAKMRIPPSMFAVFVVQSSVARARR